MSVHQNYSSFAFSGYEIDLSDAQMATYLEPGSTKPGDVAHITGTGTVTEIGWYDGAEYWHVTTTDENGSTISTWINTNDFASTEAMNATMKPEASAVRYAALASTEGMIARDKASEKDSGRRQEAQKAEFSSRASAYGLMFGAFDLTGEQEITIGKPGYKVFTGKPITARDANSYISRMARTFGMPPQWTDAVDPRVLFGDFMVGRRYTETILASPTILSLCPGKLVYNDGLLGAVEELAEGDVAGALTNGTFEPFWQFEELWHNDPKEGGGYLNYCNILCRYAAICLTVRNGELSDGGEFNLAQKATPWGGTYATMDMQRLLDPAFFSQNTGGALFNAARNGMKNIVSNVAALFGFAVQAGTTQSSDFSVWETLKKNLKAIEYHFVHFNANGQLAPSESFATETRPTVIETMINGAVTDTIKDVHFLLSGEMGSALSGDLATFGTLASESLGGAIGSLLGAGSEILRGGTIAFPQVIDNCTWGREFQFTCKFTSMYGDVESRFLNVIMPYLCLMAFFLPKQLKHKIDMYAHPPVVRAFARGIYACDIGVLTGIQVKRGGEDDTAWTASGQPMEIDVTFSIKALHTSLMQSDSQIWFAKNIGLQLYIGTLCGIDMTVPHKYLIQMTLAAFTEGFFIDGARNFSYGLWKAIAHNPIANLDRKVGYTWSG